MVKVYPHRYDMKVLERKALMYYMVESSGRDFSVMADVREKMVNLTNLVEQGIIIPGIKSEL